jgi:hypothetical protein
MPLTTVDQGLLSTNAQYTGFKNRLINGGMVIDQRNNGVGVTITDTSNLTYTLDRWAAFGSDASKFSVQQNAGSVTPPSGFTSYLGVTSLAATSLVSNSQYTISQSIEGFNVNDLGWGTANAQTVTLSFWVRSSLTGTFGGVFVNSALARGYGFTYTISVANTWEQKFITVPGDTTGTWLTNNGTGIRIYWGLGVGSSFGATAGTWSAGSFRSATGATSVVGTNGATWYVTGVQLEKGATATSFDYRSYGVEELLCFRYTQVLSGTANSRLFISGNTTGAFCFPTTTLKARMRTTPSITTSAMANFTFESLSSSGQTPTSISYNSGVNDTLTVQVQTGSSISGPGGNLQCANTSAQVIISAEL